MSAYLEQGLLKRNPFETIDQGGRRRTGVHGRSSGAGRPGPGSSSACAASTAATRSRSTSSTRRGSTTCRCSPFRVPIARLAAAQAVLAARAVQAARAARAVQAARAVGPAGGRAGRPDPPAGLVRSSDRGDRRRGRGEGSGRDGLRRPRRRARRAAPGRHAAGLGCARSTPRRPARSPSTPRRACTTASGARPRATSSPSSARSSTSTSSRRWKSWPPGPGSRCTTTTPAPRRSSSAEAFSSRPWRGRSSGTTSACSPGPTPPRPASYLRRRARLRRPRRSATFKLGWAPDGWDALVRALDLPRDVLTDAGLGFVNKAGPAPRRLPGPGDLSHLRRRRPGGRASAAASSLVRRAPSTRTRRRRRCTPSGGCCTDSTGPRTASSTPSEVIVCEGYTDVIGLSQPALPRAVATCGTALADGHVRILKNFARRIVLAYDADAAGQGAAERFYEWEKRFDVDIVVAALPAGADPGRPGGP